MKIILIFNFLVMMISFYFSTINAQETTPDDFVLGENETLEMSSDDLSSLDDSFFANSKLIAQDIMLYDENEIKDYPLIDLSPEEITAVFSLLDSGNISKVLINIPSENIKKIQDKISYEEFQSILDRLPNETSDIIRGNLGYNTTG